MSKERAKKFLEKINQDPEFKKKWMNASPEEAKKIIQEEDFSFTKDEFREAYQELLGRELNQEELAQVAAGIHPDLNGVPLAYLSE